MRRLCDVENVTDFCRYYANSWVGFHSSDATFIQPALVGTYPQGDYVFLRTLSKDPEGNIFLNGQFALTWKEIAERIDFGVPDSGMMPEGPTFVYASYNSPRQPRKGYRPRDLAIRDFNNWAIRTKYTSPNLGRDRGNDWVWFAFNPEYGTLPKALEQLDSGEKVGVPLSRTLGVYSSPRYKHSLLAYKRWTVGYLLDPSSIFILPQYEDYSVEIARQTGAKVSTI